MPRPYLGFWIVFVYRCCHLSWGIDGIGQGVGMPTCLLILPPTYPVLAHPSVGPRFGRWLKHQLVYLVLIVWLFGFLGSLRTSCQDFGVSCKTFVFLLSCGQKNRLVPIRVVNARSQSLSDVDLGGLGNSLGGLVEKGTGYITPSARLIQRNS